ncbi:hypothetical protein RIF29_37789 [Crotalaria pallida]|uniref:tRNA (guanine-N(7)-)-methyltransferase non-catalytic subunit n=1 Tax=Crotalaria pallida TaxID=3830 RepID=A0AAN9DYY9_CROPI
MEEVDSESNNKDGVSEVAPALIAVHPLRSSVAVALGSDLRVFDLLAGCAVSLVVDDSVSGAAFHKDSIRAIRFGANGKLFVSAGDDKTLNIWSPLSSSSWRCISTVSSEKRISAVAISNDGSYVCFADKFGVVWVVDISGFDTNQPLLDKRPTPLLSHYCSIITSLEFSPDDRFILSADRDFKIRVTNFPKKPLNGAHEIQSFCLGHTEFVSCLAFFQAQKYPQRLLSGSGDSTVRLWVISSGALLDTCEVATKAGLLEANGSGKAEDHGHAVTDLCTTLDGLLVAVAIQSLQGIVLLSHNVSAHTLTLAKVVSIEGEAFVPTCLGYSPSARELWMITGVSGLPGSSHPSFARIRVISGIDVEQDAVVLGDDKIPGGEKLLETLQGTASVDENAFVAAAEAVKTAMCNLLIKKQYSSENRESRKKTRNDRKLKQ